MFDKLAATEDKYRAMEARMSDPALLADAAGYARLMKEYKNLTPIVETYREYCRLSTALADAQELLHSGDTELRQLAAEELAACKPALAAVEEKLKILLIPRDPNDDRNVVVEIRACAGGEEAALFAADLYRMYSMYAAAQGYRLTLTNTNETDLGGFREISFIVEGEGAWQHFKFESGVHRVQRVPLTESQGRIQTSTATVAVLPEAEEIDIQIKDSDIIFESCKSSGAGGQHINKTESAVRLTHKPSGMVVECDSERSQTQNKEHALAVLRTRLYDQKNREQNEAIASTRRAQVGSGDRSEKIRTYNYPQSRVTDHRIGFSLYSLDAFMNGDMNPLIEALIASETAEKLKAQSEEDI